MCGRVATGKNFRGLNDMAKPFVKISTERLRSKMMQYEAVTGKTVSQTVRNFSRVLALELMKRTAPPQIGGSATEAKKTGEQAITKDISLTTNGLNAQWLARYKEAIDLGLTSKTREFRRKDGSVWLTDKFDFTASLETALAHHQQERKRGRGGYRPPVRKTKDVGRWKAWSMLVVPLSVEQSMRKKLIKKVGIAKAGWAQAGQECKADTKAAETLRGIPAWVKRHMVAGRGSARDRAGVRRWRAAANPRISISSGIRHMDQLLKRGDVQGRLDFVRGKYLRFLTTAIKAELQKKK